MNKNLSELRELAKKYNIKGISKYRKPELIELLNKEMNKEEGKGEASQEKESQSEQNSAIYEIKKEGSVLREKISPKKYETNNTHLNNSSSNVEGQDKKIKLKEMLTDTLTTQGVLEINENNNYGFLRCHNYLSGSNDVYVSPSQIRKFNLSWYKEEPQIFPPRFRLPYQTFSNIDLIEN